MCASAEVVPEPEPTPVDAAASSKSFAQSRNAFRLKMREVRKECAAETNRRQQIAQDERSVELERRMQAKLEKQQVRPRRHAGRRLALSHNISRR